MRSGICISPAAGFRALLLVECPHSHHECSHSYVNVIPLSLGDWDELLLKVHSAI